MFVALLSAVAGILADDDFWKLVALGAGFLLFVGIAINVTNSLSVPQVYPAAMVVDGRA